MDTDRKLREAWRVMKETEDKIKTLIDSSNLAPEVKTDVYLHLAFMQGDVLNLVRI